MASYAPGFIPRQPARFIGPVLPADNPYNVPIWQPSYRQVRPGTWVNRGRHGFALQAGTLQEPIRNPYALNQWRKKYIPGYADMTREERYERANPEWTDVWEFDEDGTPYRIQRPLYKSPAWYTERRNIDYYNRFQGQDRIARNRWQAQQRWEQTKRNRIHHNKWLAQQRHARFRETPEGRKWVEDNIRYKEERAKNERLAHKEMMDLEYLENEEEQRERLREENEDPYFMDTTVDPENEKEATEMLENLDKESSIGFSTTTEQSVAAIREEAMQLNKVWEDVTNILGTKGNASTALAERPSKKQDTREMIEIDLTNDASEVIDLTDDTGFDEAPSTAFTKSMKIVKAPASSSNQENRIVIRPRTEFDYGENNTWNWDDDEDYDSETDLRGYNAIIAQNHLAKQDPNYIPVPLRTRRRITEQGEYLWDHPASYTIDELYKGKHKRLAIKDK